MLGKPYAEKFGVREHFFGRADSHRGRVGVRGWVCSLFLLEHWAEVVSIGREDREVSLHSYGVLCK